MCAAHTSDDELIESLRRDGWIVQYVKGWERVAGMHPRTGTIYYLSTSHHQFLTFALQTTQQAHVYNGNPWSLEPWEDAQHANQNLIAIEYRVLPASTQEFPRSATTDPRRPLYGQQREWREYAHQTRQALLRRDAPRQGYAPSVAPSVMDTSQQEAAAAVPPPMSSPPPPQPGGQDMGTEVGGISSFVGLAQAAGISQHAGASPVLRALDPKALQQSVPSFFAMPGQPAPHTTERGSLLSLARPVIPTASSNVAALPSFWSAATSSAAGNSASLPRTLFGAPPAGSGPPPIQSAPIHPTATFPTCTNQIYQQQSQSWQSTSRNTSQIQAQATRQLPPVTPAAMRDALLNIATIMALQQTQEVTTLQPQPQLQTPNPPMAAPMPPLPPIQPPVTFPLAISSSVGTSSAVTKVSPAQPLTPQDIQQLVENIVDQRENERGRVLSYNQLYAFVEEPRNTLLLLTPPTLETYIRDQIQQARTLNLPAEGIPVRFEDIRAVADGIVYDAQRVFAAIPKPTPIVLPSPNTTSLQRTQTQTSSRTSSITATTSQTAATTNPPHSSVAGLLPDPSARTRRSAASGGWGLPTDDLGDWSAPYDWAMDESDAAEAWRDQAPKHSSSRTSTRTSSSRPETPPPRSHRREHQSSVASNLSGITLSSTSEQPLGRVADERVMRQSTTTTAPPKDLVPTAAPPQKAVPPTMTAPPPIATPTSVALFTAAPPKALPPTVSPLSTTKLPPKTAMPPAEAPSSAADIAASPKKTARPSRQKKTKRAKERTHAKRRNTTAEGEETSEQIDLTSEATSPTKAEATTSSVAETSLLAADLSAEQKTLQQQFDEQIAAERQSKSKKKKKAPIKKTTIKSPALIESDGSSSLEEIPEENSPERSTERSKRRKQDTPTESEATTKPKSKSKPKKPSESEKHQLPPDLLVNLTKQFPLYPSKSTFSYPPPIRPESPPTDPDTIDLTEPRTHTRTRPTAAAPTRGKDMTDYAPIRHVFEESVKAPRNIIATNVLPALAQRANEYGVHLVRVGLDNVPELRSIFRLRVHVRYPNEEQLWQFVNQRVLSEDELHFVNFFRQLDDPEFLPMTEAKIAVKVRKVQSEGKGRRLHSGELLHRFSININGLVPTLESAYLRGMEHAVIENTGTVYLSTLYEMVREFVHLRTTGDLQFAAIDVCEISWIRIWPIACTMFTPSTGMHEILLLALDLEAEQPVQRGDRPNWPPEWLPQEDTNASADASASASTSAEASATPISAVNFLLRHVPQNYHRFRPLYTRYQPPPSNLTTEDSARQFLYYWCGDPQSYSPHQVEFACTVEDVEYTRRMSQEALASLPASWAKRHEGRRTPAWVYFLGQVSRAQVQNDDLRCRAITGYFMAIHREYESVYCNRNMPTEPARVEDPILRDVGVETAYSVRDLLTTPTAVFAQVENRVECHTAPELYNNCKLERCLIVSFAVAYQPADKSGEADYLEGDEYIAFPTDILLGNVNGTPLAYIGSNAPDLRRSTTRGMAPPPPAACRSIKAMRDAFLRQRGKNGILVGWQLDSLLSALRLSIPESATIDLAFNPQVRRYVAQLASQAGLPPVLVRKLFPLDVRYGIDVRYVAALLSDPEHLLELALNGERDLAYEMAFTAALTRHLWDALCARTTLLFNDLAYRMLRVGAGNTPWASVDGDPQLRNDFRRTVQFCYGELIGTPALLSGTQFARALKVDFRRAIPGIPQEPVAPWSAGSALTDFYVTLNSTRFPPINHPSHMASDYVQVVCGLHQFRSRHDEQPFLRSLRHPPCVVSAAQVDFRLAAINHCGLASVDRLRRLLLDKQTQNEMAAMPETHLWYGAACVAFLDGTLSITALLQRCPEYRNIAMQEEQSPFPTMASTAPLTSVAPAPAIIESRPMETSTGGEDPSNDPPPLQIAQPLAEPTGSENRRSSVAPNSSTERSTSPPSAVASPTEKSAKHHARKPAQTQQVVQPRTTRQSQRRMDSATLETDDATASAEMTALPPVEPPSTPAAEATPPAIEPASKSPRPPLIERRTSPRKTPTK